jgi:hypothetical protein
VTLRRGRLGDLDALVALENAVFATDILSRSFCRFLAAPNGRERSSDKSGRGRAGRR